jgi:signal transduction histidine kinase
VAFICGLQDAQSQEAAFLQLRAEKERAEADAATKARLLAELAQNFRRSVTQLLELLGPVNATGSERLTGEVIAEARLTAETLASEMTNIESLLASVSASSSVRERCSPATLVGEVVETLGARSRTTAFQFANEESPEAASEVWLDTTRFKQLVHYLLTRIIAHSNPPRIVVKLKTQLHSRALVAVEVQFQVEPPPNHEADPVSTEFEMYVATGIATAIGARLSLISLTPLYLQLDLDAPRAG